LRQQLHTLREAGADAFDGPGFRFIEGLLGRAEDLQGAAGEQLRRRAAERLLSFRDDFEAARAEARAKLETLEAAGAPMDTEVSAAYDRGDYKTVLRHAPRMLRRAQSTGAVAARARARRLADQARARGLPLEQMELPLNALDGVDEAEARSLGDRLAAQLFRDAADHARSALVLARTVDAVSDEAGHYNPQALAARTLGLVEAISPDYLRAYLTGLEDLASLRRLPAPKARRRRGR
jgi:hypothetical protein